MKTHICKLFSCKKILKTKRQKYCNRECYKIAGKKEIKERVNLICPYCNKKHKRFLSQRNRKFCSKRCYYSYRIGKKRPEHSLFMKGKQYRKGIPLTKEHRQKLSGINNPRWRGGITNLYHKIRRLPEYNNWRLKIFIRDKFCCIWCSSNKIIEADHIKSFATIIFSNKISSTQDALKCNNLWSIKNGRTLCRECHKKTKSYGKNFTTSSTIVNK